MKVTAGNISWWSAKCATTKMIASWRVLWYFAQTGSKLGGTRSPCTLTRSLGAHPRQFPYTLARSAPAYSRNVFCEEERKTRDKEENKKGKERERSKALWVRCRENFERKSRRLWFELCDGSARPKVTAGYHLSQILNHKNDYFMASFVTFHSNLWIFHAQSPFFFAFSRKVEEIEIVKKKVPKVEFGMILCGHPTPFFSTRCQGQPGHADLAGANSFQLSTFVATFMFYPRSTLSIRIIYRHAPNVSMSLYVLRRNTLLPSLHAVHSPWVF